LPFEGDHGGGWTILALLTVTQHPPAIIRVGWPIPFALLTDTKRPLRIGKQSKGPDVVIPEHARRGVAYR